jgi:hypothetical protein
MPSESSRSAGFCRSLRPGIDTTQQFAESRTNAARGLNAPETLGPQIDRVRRANMQVYGADKVWRQLEREVTAVA